MRILIDTTNADLPDEDCYRTRAYIMKKFGVCRQTTINWEDRLPPHIMLMGRCLWKKADIDNWAPPSRGATKRTESQEDRARPARDARMSHRVRHAKRIHQSPKAPDTGPR